jgi:hypothetical protein
MYGESSNLSREVPGLRFRSMINAPAAKSTPPKQKAPIIIPMLAPLDKGGFGHSDVAASAIPVAPADTVAVILVTAVTVAVGMLDVVRGTLVVVSSIEGKPYSEHAADT